MGKLLDKLRNPRPAAEDSELLFDALRKAQVERDAARASQQPAPEANGASPLVEDPPVVPVDVPQVERVPDVDPPAMEPLAVDAPVELESAVDDDRRQRVIIAALIAAAVACAILAWTAAGVD